MTSTEGAIVERIHNAILEHRLPAGTKLGEKELCEAFATTRARIRRVFLLLSSRGMITLQSNRGAFVAEPTADDAQDTFEARRVIEVSIVHNLAAQSAEIDLTRLEHNVAQQGEAYRTRNRREAIRLSGEFHVLLAELGGNPIFRRMVEDLVTRSSLIIGLFGSAAVSDCSEDEHRDLLQAIARGDGDRAGRLMLAHLNHIESELQIGLDNGNEISLNALFGG